MTYYQARLGYMQHKRECLTCRIEGQCVRSQSLRQRWLKKLSAHIIGYVDAAPEKD